MKQRQHLILYHVDCIDGFGAAWAAWKKFGETAEYVAVAHGDVPPDVSGRIVYILDFSYDRATLMDMASKAQSLTVVDHHKTAMENLAGLTYCHLDMSKSGAVLAWEHFHPGVPAPALLLHIQDKDLWQWKMADSREITAALRCCPFTFDQWSLWVDGWDTQRELLVIEGRAILGYQDGVVRLIAANAREIGLGGHRVLSVNTPILQSEIAGQLAEGRPFGVAWYEAKGRRYYSLRSRDGGVDVADLAKRFGGGGHAKAAGFSVVLPEFPGDDPTPR